MKNSRIYRAEIDPLKNQIDFVCQVCGVKLLFWFDGVEYIIWSAKCNRCHSEYTLTVFFINCKERIKKRLRSKFIEEFWDIQIDIEEEFQKRLNQTYIRNDKITI